MKKIILICSLILLLFTGHVFAGDAYESLKLINSSNWGVFWNGMFTLLPESRGGLNLSPVDAYLLYRVIPAGIPIKIKPYKIEKNDLSFMTDKVPFLAQITATQSDIEKHIKIITYQTSEVVVYPSLHRLFILVNAVPYAQAALNAGGREEYLPVISVRSDGMVRWSSVLALPLKAGDYKTLNPSSQYLSGTYYNETVIPFGAWLVKSDGAWTYQIEGNWFKAPDFIASDLALPSKNRSYRYFDESPDGSAARWGSNIFGEELLFWSKNGEQGYPQIGFAPGDLVYQQKMLLKDLVDLLTSSGPDDFDSCIARNPDFRSFNSAAFEESDPQIIKAVSEYRDNRLPRDPLARKKTLGLYYYALDNSTDADRQILWHNNIKKDWSFFELLRSKLREDFARMGIFSQENRQNVLEEWLVQRLAYEQASPPSEAKYVQPLNFSDFFRPLEKRSVFTEREREVMRPLIRKAVSGEAGAINLRSVDSLNNYNFGRILNDILGDLYRSHGCLHVSPRNIYVLYKTLPERTKIVIHPYSQKISGEAFALVPLLSDLVDFSEDVEKIKGIFGMASGVRIEVYTDSGLWIIYLKDKPYAKLIVKGGPREVFYMVDDRNSKGLPVFSKDLAYPTTPGDYKIYDKVIDYVSSLYRDTTIVPQGAPVKKQANKWIFQDRDGNWQALPKSISDDISRLPEARGFTYYDEKTNGSGEVIDIRWGSQPFGKYAMRIAKNGKGPSPELIHTSGDLIMEERQLVNDLIKTMAAPSDDMDDCIDNNTDFAYYRDCYRFISDQTKGDVLDNKLKAYYKLYYGLPLATQEAALLPRDSIAADKAIRRQPLSKEEINVLISAGVAKIKNGKAVFDDKKLRGLRYDTYQYVVIVEKYAHHYIVLKQYWTELAGLRDSMLEDFNNFVLKDPKLFYSFMREVMLSRIGLERLSQEKAIKLLDALIK
ncbi:MAG: L,D-transpeptidase [Candidatus Margulisiibacteriota bacterium]